MAVMVPGMSSISTSSTTVRPDLTTERSNLRPLERGLVQATLHLAILLRFVFGGFVPWKPTPPTPAKEAATANQEQPLAPCYLWTFQGRCSWSSRFSSDVPTDHDDRANLGNGSAKGDDDGMIHTVTRQSDFHYQPLPLTNTERCQRIAVGFAHTFERRP